jgi:ADP-ribosyl-[dinitrogen reductase] hydrolase
MVFRGAKRMHTKGFYGAIIGDIVGSVYEEHDYVSEKFPLFSKSSHFTDDTVLTIATMDLLLHGVIRAPLCNHYGAIASYYRRWANRFPDAGYGRYFYGWMKDETIGSYQSEGNGAAMRISPIAYLASSEEDCLYLVDESSAVTHDSYPGTAGARVIALLTYQALHGASKEKLRQTALAYYPEIRKRYKEYKRDPAYTALAKDTVPEAVAAFLDSSSFEDCIRKAILLTGDTDTLAAMAGSIAGAFYGIDDSLVEEALERISDDEMLKTITAFAEAVEKKE